MINNCKHVVGIAGEELEIEFEIKLNGVFINNIDTYEVTFYLAPYDQETAIIKRKCNIVDNIAIVKLTCEETKNLLGTYSYQIQIKRDETLVTSLSRTLIINEKIEENDTDNEVDFYE